MKTKRGILVVKETTTGKLVPPTVKQPKPYRGPPKRPAQKTLKVWNKWLAPVILIAALGDWALVIGQDRICAVDRPSCEAAISAVNAGFLDWAKPGTPMRCEPAPGCRPPRELCIPGFNCE